MLKGFITWLDNYLEGEEPWAIVKAIVGVMAFASLLGVILGSFAVRLGAVVSVVLFVLSVTLLLIADRRRVVQTSDRYKRLLARYCEFIEDDDPRPTVLIKHWDQVVTLNSKGDAREFVTIKAVSMRERLYFLTLRIGPSWNQPKKYRDRVRVNIRRLSVDGNTGPSWDVTTSWLHDGRINLVAHLHDPVNHGSEMAIRMERTWPGKCIPLMRNRQPDEFILRFRQTMPIEGARYTVILPPHMDAHYEPIGFDLSDEGFAIDAGKDDEDRRRFTLTTRSFEPDHRVGMRLELK